MIRKIFLSIMISLVPLCVIGQIKLVFRFDDFKFDNDKFNDTLLTTFAKYCIPLNLSVIPFNGNNEPYIPDAIHSDAIKRGIKNKIIDIQLHGFNHQKCVIGKSEYKSLPFNDQYKRISQGKSLLDSLLDLNLKIFIPPWNSYDYSTLKVLDSLQFSCISANKWGTSSSSKIKYLPYTDENLENVPELIKNNNDKDAIIVILFHKYSFVSHHSNYSLPKISFYMLDSLLNWVNNNHIKCYTFSEIINKNYDLDASRYIANVDYGNSISNYASNEIKKPLLNIGVYYSKRYLTFIKILDWGIWIFIFAITFIVFYGLFKILKIGGQLHLFIIVIVSAIFFLVLYKRYYSMEWLIMSNISIYIIFSLIIILFLNLKTKIQNE